MQRKKGFTLVELLVAMVCATLVLAMISSTAIFLARMNDGALKQSQTLFQLQTVKDFVQANAAEDWKTPFYEQHYKVENGTVTHYDVKQSGNTVGSVDGSEKVIVSGTQIKKVAFDFSYPSGNDSDYHIVTCTISYGESDKESEWETFSFVAYYTTTNADVN